MSNPNPKNQFTEGNKFGKGAPKKEWTMSALYKQALEEMAETGEPKYKIVARKLIEKASEGDVVAIKELNNRIDGMPIQNINNSGEITHNVLLDFPTDDKV